MADILHIISSASPTLIIPPSTIISMVLGMILDSVDIPYGWKVVVNIIMISIPTISLLISMYLYTLGVYLSPIITTINSGGNDVDPNNVIRDASGRTILAIYKVSCWHIDPVTNKKVITYMYTQTYELDHIDDTKNDIIYRKGTLLRLTLEPNIIIDDETQVFLDSKCKELFDQYRMYGKFCNVTYELQIPGIPDIQTIIPDRKSILHNRNLLIAMIITIIAMPIYLTICKWNTDIIKHKITKRLRPYIIDRQQSNMPLPPSIDEDRYISPHAMYNIDMAEEG